MAAQQKFQKFVQNLGRGLVDLNSAGADKVILSNTAPNLGTNNVIADITQIANGNGYTTGGTAIGANAYSQTAGLGKLTGGDVTFTSSGAGMAAFRYVILVNTTNNVLVSMVDLGAPVSVPVGINFIVRWDAVNGILTIQ